MQRFTPALAVLLSISLLDARQEKLTCGTHGETPREEIHLHRQSAKSGIKRLRKITTLRAVGEREVAGRSVLPDAGSIAVLNDTDGVVARRNPFDLNLRNLQFNPAGAGKYRYQLTEGSYDAATAAAGAAVTGIGDDDTREVALPFEFPFFAGRFRSVFVNSDGNLTFESGDAAVSDRSLGRFTSGQPRIAALFRDLDPTRRGSIRVASDANRFVVSWVEVPEYQDFGVGRVQTFQIRLFPDGRIEYAYLDAQTRDGIVGISPGRLQGALKLVKFRDEPTGEFSSSLAERFAGNEEIDIFAAAQKFYLNHDDAYDYLVIYNNLNIDAGETAVAFETTVRNNRSGYGDEKVDIGLEAGSKRRLQAIMNMGPLSQYPKDPNSRVPARFSAGDTPLTTLAHEMGHLFLAFASVRDANDPEARPLLGYQTAHWNFRFNSDASLLEGNRIEDRGAGVSPRFLTTATVQGFSALDQYLMGLRPSTEVPDTFLVENARGGETTGPPKVGVAFDGARRNVRVDDIIAAEGRRTPDHTVSQRRFRLAFMIVTAAGQEPSAADLAQVETYRREFEAYFAKATSGNAFADTTLARGLRVSTFPAVGVLAGGTGRASVAIEQPASAPVTVLLRTAGGAVQVPPSVTIAAGSTLAEFAFAGVRAGTDELIAEVRGGEYETVHSRIQVASAEALRLSVASGDFQTAAPGVTLSQPVRFRVTDINELPYPGVALQLSVAGGGTIDGATVTDDDGFVTVRWTPGAGPANEIRAALPSGASIVATALGRPSFVANAVVNAASFTAGLTPGGIATIFGANLAGDRAAEVLINGSPAQVFFSGTRQVNFYVPPGTPEGTADVFVRTAAGTSETVRVPVVRVHPGLFFDSASGFGAILIAGTGQVTQVRPAGAGEVLEVYATGFGPVQNAAGGTRETTIRPEAMLGGRPAEVLFSGLAPGFSGLYQINVRVPAGLAAGASTLRLTASGIASNEVKVQLR